MARKFELVAFILALMLALSVLSLSGMARAWHVPSASIAPSQVWEGKVEKFVLTISNNESENNASSICKINLTVNNFTIINVTFPTSINYTFTNKSILWNLSNCINEGGSQTFKFYARADFVSNDTVDVWKINTTDNTSATNFTQVNVTIKNDIYPPRLISVSPVDFSFIKGNQISFTFVFNESESGLNSTATGIWFFHGGNFINSCQGASNWSSIGVECNESNGIYTCNWQTTEPGPYFDYTIEAEDKAGNKFNESFCSNETQKQPVHHLYLDTRGPEINLSAPENNSNFTSLGTVNFNFSVYDNSFETAEKGNFTPAINCSLYLNGEIKNSTVVNASNNATLNLTLSYNFSEDGIHSWSITCTDKAGWQATSETRRLIIDTSAPKIELISPANNSYAKTNATFRWNASDLTNITCNLSIDGEINQTLAGSGGGAQSFLANVSGLAEGLHNWSVTCWDEFSHSNASETLYFEVDAQEPQVMIIQPSLNDSNNGSYSGVGSLTILFNFTASDNKATNLSCSYVVNGETSNVNLVNGSYYEFNKTFTRTGSYMWIVKCYDLAENEGSANASFSLAISSAGGGSGGGGGSRGGGGRSYYCSPSWQCSEWSACVNGKQTRSCVDLNNCGGIPPVTERSCEVNQTNQTVSESTKSGESQGKEGESGESGGEGGMSVSGSEGIGITGGVVGALKKSWIPLVIIAGIVVIGYSFSLLLKLRKPPLASKIKFYKSIPQQL